MRHPKLSGLYAITDSTLAAHQGLLQQVEQALRGGARLIQYRDKSTDASRRMTEAQQLVNLCQRYAALLIVNDDLELALRVGANGIHLGKDDANLSTARQRLGPDAIIGVSCYNQLDLARRAQHSGADYVAFGRFFPSKTKPVAVQANLDLLQQAKRELNLPLVAIGGITPENGRSLITAGADMLAVIHGVFGEPDIYQACKRFTSLFEPEDIPT